MGDYTASRSVNHQHSINSKTGARSFLSFHSPPGNNSHTFIIPFSGMRRHKENYHTYSVIFVASFLRAQRGGKLAMLYDGCRSPPPLSPGYPSCIPYPFSEWRLKSHLTTGGNKRAGQRGE